MHIDSIHDGLQLWQREQSRAVDVKMIYVSLYAFRFPKILTQWSGIQLIPDFYSGSMIQCR